VSANSNRGSYHNLLLSGEMWVIFGGGIQR
jgi:hypothetical protein